VIEQAFVAVPRQHSPLQLADRPAATVTFVAREVDGLDAVLHPTDLGRALITTPEQTVLDLTKRPALGGMPDECRDATRVLLPRCDPERLEEIARAQRMVRTLGRLRAENP
jgi:hypothetical protein